MAVAADARRMETRRDRWGRYLVVPPDTAKPAGYTRVTTIAKTLDDGGGLIPWKATAAVVGALRRPGLHARWQALVSEHPDPWYANSDSKAACKKLVEECAQAGGSADRADLGTALHALIEQQLTGITPSGLQPGMEADVEAFRSATGALTIDPAHIEATVVLDEWKVAGTADMLAVTVPGYGDLIGDLKTGANLDFSWQAIAVQLAAYAHADNVYRQGAADDGTQDVRTPMPTVSQTHGLVIHLPAGEARCTLHIIDLEAGWEAFQHSMWTRGWRSRKKLAVPYQVPSAPCLADGGVTQARNGSPVPASTPDPLDQQDAVHARHGGHPDDGDDVAADFPAVRNAYAELDTSGKTWIAELQSQATAAGVTFHAKDATYRRRWEIIRALTLLAAAGETDDTTLRELLEPIIGACAQYPNVPVGHLVGSLSATEAATFGQLVDGQLAIHIDPQGRPSLRPAA